MTYEERLRRDLEADGRIVSEDIEMILDFYKKTRDTSEIVIEKEDNKNYSCGPFVNFNEQIDIDEEIEL